MLAPGDILGNTYRIQRLLGQGGMALVYEASGIRLPTRFAIKVLKPSFEVADLERFRREGEILAQLKHPHIVSVIDADYTADGDPYLVMEYLDGEDLAQRLHRGPLSLDCALSLLQQTASALSAAHERGVIHRDLKPSNLFLCHSPSQALWVKVLDFGIAKLCQGGRAAPATTARSLPGTPAYMSPEQALGARDLDGRSDQFSLAVIAWELFAGCPAFHDPALDPVAIGLRVVQVELPPVFSLRRDPRRSAQEQQIEQVLIRALAKRPELRFASVQEFAAALLAPIPPQTRVSPRPSFPEPIYPSSHTPEPAAQVLPETRARRPAWVAVGLGGLVLLVALAGALGPGWVRPPPPAQPPPSGDRLRPRPAPPSLPSSGVPSAQPSVPAAGLAKSPEQGSPRTLAAASRIGPSREAAPPSTPPAKVASSGVDRRLNADPALSRVAVQPVPRPSAPLPRPPSPPGNGRPPEGQTERESTDRQAEASQTQFRGGTPAARGHIERCIRGLRDEEAHAEAGPRGRWLRFVGVSALRLQPGPRPPAARGRPPLDPGLSESLERCVQRAEKDAPPYPAQAGQDSIRDLSVCIPSPRFRCPKEPS